MSFPIHVLDLAPQSVEARELAIARPGVVAGHYHLHSAGAVRAYRAIGFYQQALRINAAAKCVGLEAMLQITAALDAANLTVAESPMVRNF